MSVIFHHMVSLTIFSPPSFLLQQHQAYYDLWVIMSSLRKQNLGNPLHHCLTLSFKRLYLTLTLSCLLCLSSPLHLSLSLGPIQAPLPPTQASMRSSEHSVPELLHFYLTLSPPFRMPSFPIHHFKPSVTLGLHLA